MNRLISYRVDSARCEYLRKDIPRLQGLLQSLRDNIVDDEVHITQSLSGMPFGGAISDPTGKLGARLADGYEPIELSEIELEIGTKIEELRHKEVCVWCIETGLSSLTPKERYLVECKYIQNDFWRNIIENFNSKFGEVYVSKEPLKRMIERALETMCAVLE